MPGIKHLFQNNLQWIEDVTRKQPDFFQRLSRQQSPEYLWIGCSDSRVPANEIVGMMPGEIFVHRNIANVVVHTDLNCLSVIQYAVDVLKVKHIIVCGHYGCGGVNAALHNMELGLIDNWLRHIGDVYRVHKVRVDAEADVEKRSNLLCELNVIEQVGNVVSTTIVQNAWRTGQELSVHGFIYGVADGRLRDLGITVSGREQAGAARD